MTTPAVKMSPMSAKYRSMIYAAVATMYFYRKDIININPGETLGSFAEKNRKVMDRVFEEIRNIFDYELSSNQVGTAIKAYLCPSTSVDERPAATLNGMKGYIITSAGGAYLTRQYSWYVQDKPEEAYVHPFAMLPYIVHEARFWPTKPAKIIPSEYKDGKVTVLGEAMDFSALAGELQSSL